MYSGGDSSGDGVNSRNQFNWQMTSQTSCNINSGGSIDWASLAQQWIQMKDSGAGLPATPPPPAINTNVKVPKAIKFDEQGEADMEVEKDDELQVVGFGHNTPPDATTNNWFPAQQDPGSYCTPQQNQWTSWPTRVALPPPTLHVPITSGSLTPPMAKDAISTTPPLQCNSKTSSEAASLLSSKTSLEPPPMDAAKRKILPAWIREGLEKMEREKMKQLEREQREKDPLAAGSAPPDSDINIKFKTMVKSSTTDMEGESSGNEAIETDEAAAPYDDDDDDGDDLNAVATSANSNGPTTGVIHELTADSYSGKTYEERMSDMMIAVRKTLTELLLEVTNEEISSIAHETIRKRRAKASSAQVIRKSAIPSITGKLGLEAYADSDSDNSASDDEASNDDSKRSDDENDSEEELKANIRICKRAFAKTVEEIEERIQASAVRDELILKEHQKRDGKEYEANYNRSPLHKTKGFDMEIGEPQPDKKSNSNGKRRKERTSRFSDNKDSRHRLATSYYPPPSMGSGNLPSQVMPGSSAALPSANFAQTKYKIGNSTAANLSMPATVVIEKRGSNSNSGANKSSSKPSAPPTSSSSSSRRHRHSDSASSSSDSSTSGTRSSHSRHSKFSATHHKRSSAERSKRSHRSSSYRSSRRRDSSDSNDDDRYTKRSSRRRTHKSGSSSVYSRRHDRRRSDSRSSRSRTRSRSRSRSTTYSSSRRGDRY